MKHFFVILLLFAWFATAPLAVASDLVVSRAALEDVNGNLTITDVVGRVFKPIGPTLAKGFTKSAHWLRISVRKPAKGSEAVLFIRQPYLNEIRLFEADAGSPSGWKTRVTGNYYPYKTRERGKSTLGFVVNVTAPETTFYLRLKTRTQSQLNVEALEPEEADRRDNQLDLLEVFFTTAMLLLLLWAIHSYLLDRLKVVGLFAVHQAVYTFFGIGITGYLAPFIPVSFPQLADLSTAIPYCATTFTTLLFCRELFKAYEPPPLLMRGLDLFLLAFPLQLAAMALGHTPLAVIVNAVLVKLTWWYYVIITFTLRREQLPSRRTLKLFFVTITLVFTLFWVVSSSSTGTKNHLFARQILVANGLIIGGLFAMILNSRSRRLLLESQQAAMELQAKSEFLALVSHEIRTPLNALVGFSAMARRSSDSVQINQYLGIIEQSSHSLMELVNDILDMSKIEAGRIEIETVPFNLRQLLGSLEVQYHHLAEQKELKLRFVVADNVPDWILSDPVRLRQMLANLLANAIKFTERGEVACSISMSAHADATGRPQIRFEVHDTGIGISETSLTQLFQPFRQLDPTITRRFGGTGLGLAIVHSLVGMMQGHISVKSHEGRGSCFVIELPVQGTEPVTDNLTPAVIPTAGSVLVVEDNDFNRRLLDDLLTSWGQQVTVAEDGLQALQFMEQQRFDIILLDIRMPGIDGIEVARRIRSRERERCEPPVAIIAITADADAATREASLAAGIDAVLAKPVIPEQLIRAVAAQCGSSTVAMAGEDLQLNPQTHKGLGGDPERTRQYLELLQHDIDDELQNLRVALEQDDRNELGRAAHTLKGLCGHLANPEPVKLASWLQLNAASARREELGKVTTQLRSSCEHWLSQEDNS